VAQIEISVSLWHMKKCTYVSRARPLEQCQLLFDQSENSMVEGTMQGREVRDNEQPI
jgi:hypothetical protein